MIISNKGTTNYSAKNAKSSSEPAVPSPCTSTSIMTDSLNVMSAKHFFPFKSQLDHHMVYHSETREYKCQEPFCDRDFTHKSDLVKHEWTHSGMVYKCSQCKYNNPDERNYNQHLRKHTKETPYQCKMCGEWFKYTMQLKRHRLSQNSKYSKVKVLFVIAGSG